MVGAARGRQLTVSQRTSLGHVTVAACRHAAEPSTREGRAEAARPSRADDAPHAHDACPDRIREAGPVYTPSTRCAQGRWGTPVPALTQIGWPVLGARSPRRIRARW